MYNLYLKQFTRFLDKIWIFVRKQRLVPLSFFWFWFRYFFFLFQGSGFGSGFEIITYLKVNKSFPVSFGINRFQSIILSILKILLVTSTTIAGIYVFYKQVIQINAQTLLQLL